MKQPINGKNAPRGSTCLSCQTCRELVVVTLPDELGPSPGGAAEVLVPLHRVVGVAFFAVQHSGHELVNIRID
jgi:hypothetical protein